jgi:hypothetical protein
LFATLVVYTGGKFAAGAVDIGGNLPPASLTPVANLPLVSTTLAKLVAKLAAGSSHVLCAGCELYAKWQILRRCR